MKLMVGGIPWSLTLSNARVVPELRDQQGICKYHEQAIYINTDETPPEGYEAVVFHELAHAAIFSMGGREGLRQITGLDGDDLIDLEEYIVCCLMHAQYDLLKRNGWLSMDLAALRSFLTESE